eukprot:CAMPEP_0170169760 /NCGR_PEP_ID=MMETSP0040_2-20121228/2703_1 /TAXON_ID=641309 /ORGANISM="Lotharella oceanica, Strain CCMP622" /LENGTH=62 /DNA_ID=CAMNT_0010408709 /DNA_START=561 /DNA_END=749 /DNA_ORIENTATION=+
MDGYVGPSLPDEEAHRLEVVFSGSNGQSSVPLLVPGEDVASTDVFGRLLLFDGKIDGCAMLI